MVCFNSFLYFFFNYYTCIIIMGLLSCIHKSNVVHKPVIFEQLQMTLYDTKSA